MVTRANSTFNGHLLHHRSVCNVPVTVHLSSATSPLLWKTPRLPSSLPRPLPDRSCIHLVMTSMSSPRATRSLFWTNVGDTDTTYNWTFHPVTANAIALLSSCISCIIVLIFSSECSIQMALLFSLLQPIGPRADVFPPCLPPLRALLRSTSCPHSRPRPNARPPFVLRSIMSVRFLYRGGHGRPTASNLQPHFPTRGKAFVDGLGTRTRSLP